MELPVVETCEGCGACCQLVPVPPFLDGEMEQRKVPDELKDEIIGFWRIRFQIPEANCMWYDEETAACRHYEWRPQACRDFEIDSPSCHACRDQVGIINDESNSS